MRPDIQALMDKQQAGGKLTIAEIRTLMGYLLVLLDEFSALTQASIARAQG